MSGLTSMTLKVFSSGRDEISDDRRLLKPSTILERIDRRDGKKDEDIRESE